jgi:hypothetical protein
VDGAVDADPKKESNPIGGDEVGGDGATDGDGVVWGVDPNVKENAFDCCCCGCCGCCCGWV